MQITDTQKESIQKWIGEECGLAEIQRRLQSEFGISMTYMDVRFLLIDLGLELRDKEEPATPPVTEVAASDEGAVAPDEPTAAGPLKASGVSIELDMVTKPGAIVSGTVNFSDGVGAAWSLDQLGRLALSATTPGYKPSEEDVQAFQNELQAALEKRGF